MESLYDIVHGNKCMLFHGLPDIALGPQLYTETKDNVVDNQNHLVECDATQRKLFQKSINKDDGDDVQLANTWSSSIYSDKIYEFE